jgi:preprotein translocase subunit YajC
MDQAISVIVLVVITIAVFQLLILRPQKRRAQAQQALTSSLKVGDEIMTSSGIYGVVTSIEDATVHVEIASKTIIKIARGAVARRVADQG